MPASKNNNLNPYFFIPFILWCIAGGILLALYDQQTLFAFVNTRYSAFSNILMEACSFMGEALFIIPFLFLIFLLPIFRNRWFFITAVICVAVPALVTQWLKHLFRKPRPMVVYENQQWVHYVNTWPLLHANSFPSGHATGVFAMYCFLALAIPYKYRALGLLFYLLATATAYARLYLTAHFFADVYAGSIVGTLVALIAYHFVNYIRYRYFYKDFSA